MMNVTSTNVTIMVKDFEKSIKFYESIGLKLKQRWESNYAMMDSKGLTIGIHPGGDSESGSGSVSIGFMIDDIEAAKVLLEKNGIPAKYEDGGSGIYMHFTDPDDTVLYFVQPKWKDS